MLMDLHERAKGWLAWVIVGAVAVVFVLWGLGDYLSTSPGSETIAKINGQKITGQELQIATDRIGREYQAYLNENRIEEIPSQAFLKNLALQQLEKEILVLQNLKKQGYAASEVELNALLLSVPAFQEEGKFSAARFQQFASQSGLSPIALKDKVAEEIMSNQLRLALIEGSIVLPEEVERAYQLQTQRRDVDYWVLTASQFASDINPTAEQLSAYYQSHKALFTDPERVSVDYIELKRSDLAKQIHVTDEMIDAYYQSNMHEFMVPQSRRLSHLLIALPADADESTITAATERLATLAKEATPANFAELVKAHSDDTQTVQKGGDLGWLNQSELLPAMAQAAFELKAVGDISAPVRSDYGVHLIELTGVKAGQQYSKAQVQEQIVKHLTEAEEQILFSKALEDLSALAFEHPDSLDAIADQFKLKVQSTEPFSRSALSEGIAASPLVVAAAFSDPVLLDGSNSDVIEVLEDSDMAHVVVRLNSHYPEHLAQMKDVEAQLEAAVLNELAQQKAKSEGEAVVDALHRGEDPTTVAHIAGFEWKPVNDLTRFDTRESPIMVGYAFSMPRPIASQSTVGGFSLESGDYMVVRLRDVKDEAYKLDSPEVQAAARQLAYLRGNRDIELYWRGLQERASIKRYDLK